MQNKEKQNPWIVFDLGGVVFNLDFDRYATQASALCGISYAEFQHKYADPSFHRGESLAARMDSGYLGPQEFCEAIRSHYQVRASDEEIFEMKCSLIGSTKPDTVTLIQELAQKYRVACFSNTDVVHWTQRIMREPVMQLFHKRIASHEIQLRKPALASYQKMCSLLEAEPEQCMFFDDLLENVSAARVAQIDAHQFTDAHSAREVLRQRGVL